jgi:hypothetical protein
MTGPWNLLLVFQLAFEEFNVPFCTERYLEASIFDSTEPRLQVQQDGKYGAGNFMHKSILSRRSSLTLWERL